METKKVRCKICNNLKEGVIIRHYNLRVCLDCFPQFFKKRVQETIEKFKMFAAKDSLVVALSGGKDSMSIAKALKDLGYSIKALHINADLGEVSRKSIEIVQNFCVREKIPLKIVDLKEEVELSLEKISKILKKPVCAVCGMLRRYILNRQAEGQTIVTGHTLNDEVSFILKNMIFWNDELLARVSPFLDEKEGLTRKVKPLCLITEEETLLFCKLSNITYVDEQCPYKSEVYEIFKNLVYEINKEFPGSITGFYKGYLKRVKIFYSQPLKDISVQRCIKCGYPTTTQLCSICRLKEKLLQYKHG
ncbi:ATP-binding protein [Thermodesulfovibrio sp. 3907-1M]|uniref:ATP-binding protein n=1 Tax=Thermodesulfovibrio autotrophicus TaxID=3118333 RepID=A0AAU8GY34_9BACT